MSKIYWKCANCSHSDFCVRLSHIWLITGQSMHSGLVVFLPSPTYPVVDRPVWNFGCFWIFPFGQCAWNWLPAILLHEPCTAGSWCNSQTVEHALNLSQCRCYLPTWCAWRIVSFAMPTGNKQTTDWHRTSASWSPSTGGMASHLCWPWIQRVPLLPLQVPPLSIAIWHWFCHSAVSTFYSEWVVA